MPRKFTVRDRVLIARGWGPAKTDIRNLVGCTGVVSDIIDSTDDPYVYQVDTDDNKHRVYCAARELEAAPAKTRKKRGK